MLVVDQQFLKLSCDQDFPSECFEFRGVWNIIDTGGGQNKIINSVQFICGNYYNRLIIDMLIVETAAF